MTRTLCLYCALGDERREGVRADGAVAVDDGTSLCEQHAGPSATTSALGRFEGAPCAHCEQAGLRHSSWLVVDGVALCIRHAADEVYPHDDMAAHQMAHDLYLSLHAEGVQDRY